MNDRNLPLVDLVTYLRVYSLLLNAGMSLMRIMTVLTPQIVHPRLREAHLDVMRQVEEDIPVSKAMLDHQDVFSLFLIGLVRAGEVGGVLDETMARAAEFYEKQLVLRRDRLVHQAAARLTGQAVVDRYEAALAEAEPLTMRQYSCYMLGTMLASGVPIVQALQTAAEILPDHGRDIMTAAAQGLRSGQINSLDRSFMDAGFPPEVIQLVVIGEEGGTLDRTLLQAGDILGARIDGILLRALSE